MWVQNSTKSGAGLKRLEAKNVYANDCKYKLEIGYPMLYFQYNSNSPETLKIKGFKQYFSLESSMYTAAYLMHAVGTQPLRD